MAAQPDRPPASGATLTPLVRQLASQLRATRSEAVAKSFPRRDAEARPNLRQTMDAIARAAQENLAGHEANDILRRRLEDAEARIEVQAQQLADAEGKLRSAVDETRRERVRSEEVERRAAELLEKTQAMLNDASERLRQAEARADGAQGDLDYLKQFVQDRLAFPA